MEKTLISKASTYFKKNDKNRNTNVYLAAKAINNIVLNPNEEFSFNKVVGERTEERGYKPGDSIDNKKIVKTIGGGICQVSTTLNMAVYKAKMKILEVHPHSIPVKYSRREDEAAVSWGELDFRFINIKEYPIEIETNMNEDKGVISVTIWGIK